MFSNQKIFFPQAAQLPRATPPAQPISPQIQLYTPVQQYNKLLEFNIGQLSPIFQSASPVEQRELLAQNPKQIQSGSAQQILSPRSTISVVDKLKAMQRSGQCDGQSYELLFGLAQSLSTQPECLRQFIDFLRKTETYGRHERTLELIDCALGAYLSGSSERSFPGLLLVKRIALMRRLNTGLVQYQKLVADVVLRHARRPCLVKQRVIDRVSEVLIEAFHEIAFRQGVGQCREIFLAVSRSHRDVQGFTHEYLEKIEHRYGSLDFILQTLSQCPQPHHPTYMLLLRCVRRAFPDSESALRFAAEHIGEDDDLNHSVSSRQGSQVASCQADFFVATELEVLQTLLQNPPDDYPIRCAQLLQNPLFRPDQRWRVLWCRFFYALRKSEQNPERFLKEAYKRAPSKHKPQVLVALSRCYRQAGYFQQAHQLLEAAMEEQNDWKVAAEFVSLCRIHQKQLQGIVPVDFQFVETQALACSNASRVLVQLVRCCHASQPSQFLLLKKYLQMQPRAGDIWLETARYFMNPLYDAFSLKLALQALQTALELTPQNADVCYEYCRLAFLRRLLGIPVAANLEYLDVVFLGQTLRAELSYGDVWAFLKHLAGGASVNSTVCTQKAVQTIAYWAAFEGVCAFQEIYLGAAETSQANERFQSVKEYFQTTQPQRIQQYITGYMPCMFKTFCYTYDYAEFTGKALWWDL